MKLVAAAALAAALVSCASPPPPEPAAPAVTPAPASVAPVAPVAPAATTPVATSTASPPPAVPAASAAQPSDACHVTEELAAAYRNVGQGENEAVWTANGRAKLLSEEDAERALPGITQEIISALAHRRYDKLAAFAGPDGICMRAAKGAACQMLSPRALAGCAASGVKTEWNVDDGKDTPERYTCSEAFKRIFYARDFLHVGKPRFNCFPAPGRGNNASPVMASGPRLGYVELYSEGNDGFRSLWLVFDGSPTAPELVELISDYPGI